MLYIHGDGLFIDDIDKPECILFKDMQGLYFFVSQKYVENVLRVRDNKLKLHVHLQYEPTETDLDIAPCDGEQIPTELGDELFAAQSHNQSANQTEQSQDKADV